MNYFPKTVRIIVKTNPKLAKPIIIRKRNMAHKVIKRIIFIKVFLKEKTLKWAQRFGGTSHHHQGIKDAGARVKEHLY